MKEPSQRSLQNLTLNRFLCWIFDALQLMLGPTFMKIPYSPRSSLLSTIWLPLILSSLNAQTANATPPDPPFLQIRFSPSLQQEDASNYEGPLDLKMKNGTFEDAKFNAQIKKIEIEGSKVILKSVWLLFQAKRFEYKKAFVFGGECRDIELEWSPGDLNLVLPKNLEFSITGTDPKNKDSSQNTILVKSNHEQIKNWLKSSFSLVLHKKRVESDLTTRMSCPSNLEDVISGTIKAKVSNFSSDKDFDSILSKLTEGLEKELNGLLKDHLSSHLGPWINSVTDKKFNWRVDIKEEEWSVTVYQSPLNALNLNFNARYHNKRARPLDAVSFSANQAFLDFALKHIFEQKISTLGFVLNSPLKFEDFRGTVPEIADYDGNKEFAVRFLPLACPDPIPPKIRPFISRNGLSHGIDAFIHLEAQILDPQDESKILAKRKISMRVEFLLRNKKDKHSSLTYQAASWVWDAIETEDCSIQRLPAQLGLSLEWGLSSLRFKNDLQKQVKQYLPTQISSDVMPWTSFVLGDTRESRARPQGGYFAQNLVLEWNYKQ